MEIIKVFPHYIQQEKLEKIVRALRSGKVLVYPTDTIYGMGVDIRNKKALNRLYRIKGRPEAKPLSMIVSGKKQAEQYIQLTGKAEVFWETHLPGKYTLVAPVKKRLSQQLQENNMAAVRYIDARLPTKITESLGSPITATSANISGESNLSSVPEIVKVFERRRFKPDLIIDAGILRSKASTVVRCWKERCEVLRKGAGKIDDNFVLD